jgi:hypothetical protein
MATMTDGGAARSGQEWHAANVLPWWRRSTNVQPACRHRTGGRPRWRLATGSAWLERPRDTSADRWATPDARRRLQLTLAALWLLDAVLQFQAFMFSRSFPRMLAEASRGNPAVIASPISWSAGLVERHVAVANVSFATIQLLLALGIACGVLPPGSPSPPRSSGQWRCGGLAKGSAWC